MQKTASRDQEPSQEEKARRAQREYMRRWAARNKARRRDYAQRYWARKYDQEGLGRDA